MQFDEFTLQGFSLGGIETALYVPQWRLAIDVGRGPRALVGARDIALTHTHPDHAAGLPYLLALRALFRMPPPKVYVPAQMVDALRTMLDAWQPLQRYDLACELIGVSAGERYKIAAGLEMEPYRTYHVVPSVGYRVFRSVDKLRPELADLPGAEIGRRRKAGEDVTVRTEVALLSVSGDTLPEVLDRSPQAADAKVFVCECTFLDARKPKDAVRAGGHIHLDDLLARSDAFAGTGTLVPSHFSQIYSGDEIPKLLAPLAAAIPGELIPLPTTPPEAWLQ